jgi:hypothetical protein
MTDKSSRLKDELRRLTTGPAAGERPAGVGIIRLRVSGPTHPAEILQRARQVVTVIDQASLDGWPAAKELVPQLPDWFTAACSEPMSQEQAEEWLAWWKRLPAAKQAEAANAKGWSVDNWLYWMEPVNRQWFWWDAQLNAAGEAANVVLDVDDWPAPWGALKWLFRTAGASVVKAEGDE